MNRYMRRVTTSEIYKIEEVKGRGNTLDWGVGWGRESVYI